MFRAWDQLKIRSSLLLMTFFFPPITVSDWEIEAVIAVVIILVLVNSGFYNKRP